MHKPPANTLKTIVEERLLQLGRTPTEAARAGDLEESFLRDILRGKKRSVHGSNLEKLAKALDFDIGDLLKRQERGVWYEFKQNSRSPVFVVGALAQGIWIDTTKRIPGASNTVASDFPPDPRFPEEAQFDLAVRDDSISRFARDGQCVRCVSLDLYPWELERGNMVVVEETKGSLQERFGMRVLRRSATYVTLGSDSDNPLWSRSEVLALDNRRTTDAVKIVAVILFIYEPASRTR